jgi:NADPH-ferrihemoprotein reductase
VHGVSRLLLSSHSHLSIPVCAAVVSAIKTMTNAHNAQHQQCNVPAHPHHYNAFSISVDQKLQELNGKAFLPLTLGDDGDCIDDDFDQWEALVLQTILQNYSGSGSDAGQGHMASFTTASAPAAAAAEVKEAPVVVVTADAASVTMHLNKPTAIADASPRRQHVRRRACPGSTSECGTRTVSSSQNNNNNLPFLQLQAPATEIVRPHLLLDDMATTTPSSWYQDNVVKFQVLEQVLLNDNAAANGLRELRLQLRSTASSAQPPNVVEGDTTYEAGDHILLYPRNRDYIVDAFFRTLLKEIHPHAIIQGLAPPTNNESDTHNDSSSSNCGSQKKYPHPTGITVYETLSHCVDLGATPSPSFSRLLTGLSSDQLNYKRDIVGAGRTTLDLALEYRQYDDDVEQHNNKLSLEDVLYNLPPLQPRYYSIACSELLHPDKIFVTYRPVRYVTTRGHLREGLCTSFMAGLVGPGKEEEDHDRKGSFVLGAIRNNPTFRLPTDTTKSIVMIAGGCGVGPIRAFLEERLERLKRKNCIHTDSKLPFFGDGLLFLGFRNPQDAVYQDLIQRALDAGALTASHLSFDTGLPMNDPRRGNVAQSLGKHGPALWHHFQQGGYTYVCGGARTMGAAVERQVHEILMQDGNMTPDDATMYMRNMIGEGRFCEDLAD